MARKPNKIASSTCGSSAVDVDVEEDDVKGGKRRDKRRDQNSVVRRGRGRVEGPEAWRMRERVLRKRERRRGDVCGVFVPLFFLVFVRKRVFWFLSERGRGRGNESDGEDEDLLGLKMNTPTPYQGQEKSLRNYLRQGIRDGFLSLLFDRHAGGESADFERIGTREFICCRQSHGLDHRLFERFGYAV